MVCNGNSDGEYLLVVGVMIQDQVYRYCRMCKEGVHVHFYSWFFSWGREFGSVITNTKFINISSTCGLYISGIQC